MSSEQLFKPIVNYYDIKLHIFELETRRKLLRIRRVPFFKMRLKALEEELESSEEVLKEVEDIINHYAKVNPLNKNLKFQIVKLRIINGYSFTEITNELECSRTYVSNVLSEYKLFYSEYSEISKGDVT